MHLARKLISRPSHPSVSHVKYEGSNVHMFICSNVHVDDVKLIFHGRADVEEGLVKLVTCSDIGWTYGGVAHSYN